MSKPTVIEQIENLANGKPLPPSVLVRAASEFHAGKAEYLEGWDFLIPKRMTTIIAGEPGHGKSMLVCHIAAGEARRGRVALIAAAEDSIEYTLKPRLMAEGLTDEELSLVKFVSLVDGGEEAQLVLPDHMPHLVDAISELASAGAAPSVLLVDPIGSFMGKGIDAWKTSDVRRALGPFKLMAEEFNLSVVLVAHISKGTGTNLANRLQDSSAYSQVARSILFLGLDPDDPEGREGDQRVLASFKLSVARKPSASQYRMVAMLVEERGLRIETARIERMGPSSHSAFDLLAYSSRDVNKGDDTGTGRAAPKREEAEDLITSLLLDGPRDYAAITAAAEAAGVTEKPLRAARLHLNVIVEKQGFQGSTTWRLP